MVNFYIWFFVTLLSTPRYIIIKSEKYKPLFAQEDNTKQSTNINTLVYNQNKNI